MGKILCFVYESMADFEITLTCHMLGWNPDEEFISIGYEKAPIKASSNLQYIPEITVKEAISLNDVDALIRRINFSFIYTSLNKHQKPSIFLEGFNFVAKSSSEISIPIIFAA